MESERCCQANANLSLFLAIGRLDRQACIPLVLSGFEPWVLFCPDNPQKCGDNFRLQTGERKMGLQCAIFLVSVIWAQFGTQGSNPDLHLEKTEAIQWTRWRRGRDSNPGYPRGHAAFRVRCFRPLSHLSADRDRNQQSRVIFECGRLAQGARLAKPRLSLNLNALNRNHEPILQSTDTGKIACSALNRACPLRHR